MREPYARANNTEYGSYITEKYDFVQLVSARPTNISMDIEIYPTIYAHLYFTTKLTSAMSYGRGYDLWIVCHSHSRLQEIYNLPRCFSYGCVDDFVDAFGRALAYFYSTPA